MAPPSSNRGEQRGACRAAELQAGVEHGIAVRHELRCDVTQRIGHDIGKTKRITKSENEVETGKRDGCQSHGKYQQQNRPTNRGEKRAENRTHRSETVVQHTSHRCEKRADQRTRQHQRAGQERAGSQRKLRHIGDHITETDADDRQQHVGDQM